MVFILLLVVLMLIEYKDKIYEERQEGIGCKDFFNPCWFLYAVIFYPKADVEGQKD